MNHQTRFVTLESNNFGRTSKGLRES